MIAVILAIIFGVIIITVVTLVAVFVSKEQVDVKQDMKSLIGSELKTLGAVSKDLSQNKIDCFVDKTMDKFSPEQQIGLMGGMCTLFSIANESNRPHGSDVSGVVPSIIPPVCEKYIGEQNNIMDTFENGLINCNISEHDLGALDKLFP